jgi:hypothetical protein
MKKSATEVMQEIVYAAVIDAIGALKTASKGVPNTLLRDLNAMHANTTFADLPSELREAISASVRGAFARLLKEGYSVGDGTAAPPRPVTHGDRRPHQPRPPGKDGRPPRRDNRPGGGKPGPRPGPKPGPGKR